MFSIKKKEGPDRSIQEMWVDYCNLLIATERPGVKRLLNWMQSDMTNDSHIRWFESSHPSHGRKSTPYLQSRLPSDCQAAQEQHPDPNLRCGE
ncbi:hypothetical protein [Pseudoflavonifractor phocaeensis]|uniref:hypothetical protein n=1 Tax=Pseudoflavonifractor phocaeensis TaxID=1870988 RepID=UPI001959E9A6|nr:hypothetical protein [Pseudoflavonifractor phocaeensis]MBM6927240.1 hypothetical protein [Pseudoflavonifractor phocaeensis]